MFLIQWGTHDWERIPRGIHIDEVGRTSMSKGHLNWIGAGGEGDDRGWDAGWQHRLDGREFEWTLGVGDGQGGLVCCSPRGCRVRHDWVGELNWWLLYSNSCVWIAARPVPSSATGERVADLNRDPHGWAPTFPFSFLLPHPLHPASVLHTQCI